MPAPKTEPASEPLDLDALVAETTKEPFRFTLGGKDRELPHVELLTFDQADEMEREPFALIAKLSDNETAQAVRELPAFALEALVNAWLKHSGLKPGEFLASLRS